MQSVENGSQVIDRTPHPMAAFVQHVRVHHGGADVLMAEQFLDCPDVVTGLKEVRGERMPDCVAPGMLDHTVAIKGSWNLDRLLDVTMIEGHAIPFNIESSWVDELCLGRSA